MVQLTKDEIIKITMRLQSVRQGLVQKAPFYAILLFGLRFSLDDMVERVYTDGERIAFNPDFLKEISDRELEFIMLHEVSHVALGHPFRCVSDYDIEIFDEACDIVVNSNIYHYMGDDESFITIKGLGVMPHKNYNDEEGYNFTVEQVYDHLFKIKGKKKKDEDGTTPDFNDIFDEEEFEEEEYDEIEEDEIEGDDEVVDIEGDSRSNGDQKNRKKNKKKRGQAGTEDGFEDSDDVDLTDEGEEIDDEMGDDDTDEHTNEDSIASNDISKKKEKSTNKKETKKEDSCGSENFGEEKEDSDSVEEDDACDDGGENSGEGADGEGMGGSPKQSKPKTGGAGKFESATSAVGSLSQSNGNSSSLRAWGVGKGKGKILGGGYVKALEKLTPSQIKQTDIRHVVRFDDHSFWKGEDENRMSRVVWENRVLQTCEAVKNLKRISIDKNGKFWGNTPCFAERMLKALSESRLDWKTLLNDFIQEDICDYSFSPPDRRFGDSDFFLPDFNEKEEAVEDLLFMIDTSGSMSDDAITEVYSEIKGAIEQFNGRIKGWLGFFDATVTEPQPFDDEDEFKAIRIQGGGGTAFLPIFHYVRDYMKDKNITSIIILTDGYAPYPEESQRMDIPVLWVINNDDVTPPWGMIARIPQETKIA